MSETALRLANVAITLLLAPLVPGIINKTKALIAGRSGAPLYQLYVDVWKGLRKGIVYSGTTSWVFRLSVPVIVAVPILASAMIPNGGLPAFFSFRGDFILLIYLFGLSRFFLVLGALDTGSSFEGMGASREVLFSALAEPTLLLGFAVAARATGAMSLSNMFGGAPLDSQIQSGPMYAILAAALMIVFLAENSRIPVDDPNTHLELTMIHEVMILDHSGPDLALVEYASALKMWILGRILIGLTLPLGGLTVGVELFLSLGAMAALGIVTGAVESSMARLKLLSVPHLLVGASALAVVALILGF